MTPKPFSDQEIAAIRNRLRAEADARGLAGVQEFDAVLVIDYLLSRCQTAEAQLREADAVIAFENEATTISYSHEELMHWLMEAIARHRAHQFPGSTPGTMENWIEHAAEPQKLYLAWQAPDHLKERFRWAVGVLEPIAGEIHLRYFGAGTEFEALNQSRPYQKLLELGYQGYPGFSPKRELHAEGVAEALMRRLPPRTRPDFEAYKRQFRLAVGLKISDFALLGQTEAKLPSDGFSVVDPLNSETIACDLMLDVAGYRYYAAEDDPRVFPLGEPVALIPEPANQHDPNAVMVCARARKIGYINRLQAATFLRWLLERRVSAVLERLNGNRERPRAFIFVRVRPLENRAAA